MMRNYEDCLIESHEEKLWREAMIEKHDRELWRKAMIEKHEDYLIESHNRKS